MTATATAMVKAIWQQYFNQATAGSVAEEEAAAAADAALAPVAKAVEEVIVQSSAVPFHCSNPLPSAKLGDPSLHDAMPHLELQGRLLLWKPFAVAITCCQACA